MDLRNAAAGDGAGWHEWSPAHVLRAMDGDGLELATPRFEWVLMLPLVVAVNGAVLLREASFVMIVAALLLVFLPSVLGACLMRRYSSLLLTKDGVTIDGEQIAWAQVRLVRQIGADQPRRLPMLAPRELRLEIRGERVVALAVAPALPRRVRDPLGFVPFLHEAVAAKIAEAATA